MTRRATIAALLVLGWVAAAELQAQVPSPYDVIAKSKLDAAVWALKREDYRDAFALYAWVVRETRASGRYRAKAHIGIGNIMLGQTLYKEAKQAYTDALKMPGADPKDKKSARDALAIVEQFLSLRR